MFSVQRSPHNPILTPNKNHPWEAFAAFNWCPIHHNDEIHVLYRAMSQPDLMKNGPHFSLSVVGAGKLNAEGSLVENRRPLVVPEYDWERYGCEDPRATLIDGQYMITYTSLSQYPFNAQGIRLAVALSDDLKTIREKHEVTPFNAKAMVLFPEHIGGKHVAILTVHPDMPPSALGLYAFDSVEDLWNQDKWAAWYSEFEKHKLEIPMAEGEHFEVGAPPVLVDEGWLVVYSHIKNYFDESKRIFGIGVLLLDRNNPRTILGRTQFPIIVPETAEELHGQIDRVTFPSGALVRDGRLEIYYGAADLYSSVASVDVKQLIAHMTGDRSQYYFQRISDKPVLEPLHDDSWESRLVFNPAAINIDGQSYIIYRAMGEDSTSMFGLALTEDDHITIKERLADPIYQPRIDYETKKGSATGYSGCEDPRIVRIQDRLYMTYTAYDGVRPPRVAISSISVDEFKDRKWDAWTMPELISPEGIDDKDACLFPEKIADKYMFIHRIHSHICADFFETLDFTVERSNKCIRMIGPRPGMWDGVKVGIAGPPHRVDEGWLLFYHGVGDDFHYRVGALLLDAENPTEILGRTDVPLFEPELEWENIGEVNNVVFPCGSIIQNDTVYLYYGGADEVIGIATMKLADVIKSVM